MKSSGTPFRVIGLDLAANPKDTALCEIVVNLEEGIARIEMLKSGDDVSDDGLLTAFSRPDVARIGIDAPFGWPRPFVLALHSHAGHNVWPRDRQRKNRHFANLTLRATDVHVAEEVDGVTPLSVSADRIAVVAMRTALLLSRAPTSLVVDRSGAQGHFVEVYPAAALARWKVPTKTKIPRGTSSYKTRSKSSRVDALRTQMVRRLLDPLGGTRDEVKNTLTKTDHAIDAAVSAIVALMVELDCQRAPECENDRLTDVIPPGMEAQAKTEGWIALPKDNSLGELKQRLGRCGDK